MPFLPRRRSTLDLLADDVRAQDLARYGSQAEALNSTDGNENHAPTSRSLSDDATLELASPTPDAPGSPPLGDVKTAKRFTMRLSRHFSDSQLATRARAQQMGSLITPSDKLPGRPDAPPQIIKTAPTADIDQESDKRKPRGITFKRQKSKVESIKSQNSQKDVTPDKEGPRSIFPWGRKSMDTRSNPFKRLSLAEGLDSPLATASVSNLPLSRPSFNRSQSSGFIKTASPRLRKSALFSLPARDKRKSLFPLPPKFEQPPQYPDTAPSTPRGSTGAISRRSGESSSRSPVRQQTASVPLHQLRSASSQTAIKANVSFAPSGIPLDRHDSNRSTPSTHSSPNMGPPRRLGVRDRANTNSTLGRRSDDMGPPTPPTLNGSTRNSTSTGGRASLGGFLTLNRFRNSDINGSRHDSTSFNSKQNSLSITRETASLPERDEGETAAKYLERLQNSASRNVIAGMLSKSGDPFFQMVLRSYTRRFAFFGEPIDMSLRKFLLEAELPKETQQVDRVIQAFADRYHECNPGIFLAPDQAYIIAFSLMMLHTDAFNRNNKHKMQKADYIRNTRGQEVSEDILACFYDNICYTPFIHFDEDDFDAGSDRLSTFKSKKAKLKGAMPDPTKKSTGPVDPYYLIIENMLDVLRPSLKDSITLKDPYRYSVGGKPLDLPKIQRAFHHTGVLQIISARSRPAAFESQETRDNPAEAKPGVVDLQVTKVGIIWRKSAKRKKTRSPWSEWGAILTGSQLFFFKNVSWVKHLMNQYNTHQKHMVPPSAVVFKPPLEDFKPDALIKTDNAVALIDATYTRHKNAFTLVQHGGDEEVLLADNETELNEWLSYINYAAAFRSAGVRIRGFSDMKIIDTQPPLLKRSSSSRIGSGACTPSADPTLLKQILAARRQQMVAKIAEAEIKIDDTGKLLESMLRDARHLLLLAPVQPRTRDVIIHSAARMDAMLKWTRRDIWRTRCYRDILYMDALEDPEDIKDEALRLRPLTIYQELQSAAETVDAPASPQVADTIESEAGSVSATMSPRPPTLSSEIIIPDNDLFQTPPQSSRSTEEWSWKLPPSELNSQIAGLQVPHRRESESSAVSSSTAAHRPPSITQMSSTSSVPGYSRTSSNATPTEKTLTVTNSNQITPSSSTSKSQRDSSGHSTTMTTIALARPSDTPSLAQFNGTPESLAKSRSHRISLHRTLRDGLHESGSAQRHRKGKESASTVKTEGSQADNEEFEDATPGLERREGRFMIHGKQASVITFGEGFNGGIRLPPAVSRLSTSMDITDLSGKDGSDAVAASTSLDGASIIPPIGRARGLTTESLARNASLADEYATRTTPRQSVESQGTRSSFWDAREVDSSEDLRRSAGYFDSDHGQESQEISVLTVTGEELDGVEREQIGTAELRKLSEGAQSASTVA